MVEFGICYQLESAKHETPAYLFPSLCPVGMYSQLGTWVKLL